ncbi:MAG: hypothetical protein ISS25_04805 [Nanoarchaeota archaeon]|nr:hypothetical protein [DPANN group archaeon]MBL7117120.1 hypothetical protein [Nanoarchaeota archaeon]
MMNKRGSLNLSIQAIVILVMAMAVLGLGLGFIRTLMGQGQSQFEEAIGSVELDNPPSADEPFTADANIKVKSSKEDSFKAGVYNDGTFTDTSYVKIELGSCIPTAGSAMTIRSLAQQISEGDFASYKSMIKGNSVDAGTYVCELIAKGYTTAAAGTAVNPEEKMVKQVEIQVNA